MLTSRKTASVPAQSANEGLLHRGFQDHDGAAAAAGLQALQAPSSQPKVDRIRTLVEQKGCFFDSESLLLLHV
jgi:hypothetical protein